jgi:hypothetical protein
MIKTLSSVNAPTSLMDLTASIVAQVTVVGGVSMFQKLYRNDRIAFAYDCFGKYGQGIARYQEEILGYFDDGYARVSVRAPHGVGKSWLAALLVHHTVLTAEDDCKCITTASAWRQLEHYLWPEIKKSAKYIDWGTIGREPYSSNTELFQLKIVLNGGLVEAFGVACDDSTTIEGAHAKKLVYIFDEAKAIPRDTWNAAEGAFANANIGKTRLTSIEDKMVEGAGVVNGIDSLNPTAIRSKEERKRIKREHSYSTIVGESNMSKESVDMFGLPYVSARKFHSIPRYPVIDKSLTLPTSKVDASLVDIAPYVETNNSVMTDSAIAFSISTPGEPNGQFYDIQQHRPGYEDWLTRHITVEEAIKARRINAEWVLQRKKEWGEGSALFQNRVLGEFADASDDGLISRSWVMAACDRWVKWKESGANLPEGKRSIGIDTARQGADKTMCAVQQGMCVPIIYRYSKQTITTLAGYVKTLADGAHLNIEMDGGYGAGLYDILHSDGVPYLHPITVAAPTTWKDKSRKLDFFNV